MRISDLETLDGVTCLQRDYQDAEILAGYTSDLLSDVMAHVEEGSVLITIQAHKNTVAVAALTGVAAVIFCNNRPVTDDVLIAAGKASIAIFRTPHNQYMTSVAVAQHLGGCPAR